jgi:hypothetical protein
VSFHAGSAKYSQSAAVLAARSALTTATGSGGKGWIITDGGSETVTVENPLSFTATANNGSQITLSWNSGGSSNASYQVAYQQGATAPATCTEGIDIPYTTIQDSTGVAVTDLSNGTQYAFRLCARDSSGNFSSGVTASATTAGNCSGNCFDDAAAKALGIAIGPGGATIEYIKSNSSCSGESCFYLWKERNGNRILAASGNASDGWQKTLNRSGVGFSANDLTDAAVIEDIAGRVCPPNVFLDYDNMTATGRCLYYDAGNAAQTLDAAGTTGTEAEDWLQNWDRAATGRGTGSSYYEGNIQTCANKGMRLPTMYETTMTKPSSWLPTGDGLVSDPTWAGNIDGIPNHTSTTGYTWTASAGTYHTSDYWRLPGTGGCGGTKYYNSCSVRCVLP